MLTSRNAHFHQENSLEIPHPAAALWSVLVDAHNWPRWWPGMERVLLIEGPLEEGARIELFLTGIPDGEPARVKTFFPHEELSWERDGILGSLTRTRFRLEEVHGGTMLSLESRIFGPQAVLARYARRDDFVRYHEVVLKSLRLYLERSMSEEG